MKKILIILFILICGKVYSQSVLIENTPRPFIGYHISDGFSIVRYYFYDKSFSYDRELSQKKYELNSLYNWGNKYFLEGDPKASISYLEEFVNTDVSSFDSEYKQYYYSYLKPKAAFMLRSAYFIKMNYRQSLYYSNMVNKYFMGIGYNGNLSEDEVKANELIYYSKCYEGLNQIDSAIDIIGLQMLFSDLYSNCKVSNDLREQLVNLLVSKYGKDKLKDEYQKTLDNMYFEKKYFYSEFFGNKVGIVYPSIRDIYLSYEGNENIIIFLPIIKDRIKRETVYKLIMEN